MIVKAALLLFRNKHGTRELMFVRAKDKSHFIFPGGKREKHETIEQALERELKEELQSGITRVSKLGVVEGVTPEGIPLIMHLFTGSLINEPVPSSEIEEIAWLTKDKIRNNQDIMTPMTLNYIVPFLQKNNLWL